MSTAAPGDELPLRHTIRQAIERLTAAIDEAPERAVPGPAIVYATDALYEAIAALRDASDRARLTEAALTGADRAGWSRGYPAGRDDGYRAGWEAGRAALLAEQAVTVPLPRLPGLRAVAGG